MSADMSRRAVSDRLRIMNELWLLSVKLMNSKKLGSADERKNELSDNTRDPRSPRKKG